MLNYYKKQSSSTEWNAAAAVEYKPNLISNNNTRPQQKITKKMKRLLSVIGQKYRNWQETKKEKEWKWIKKIPIKV